MSKKLDTTTAELNFNHNEEKIFTLLSSIKNKKNNSSSVKEIQEKTGICVRTTILYTLAKLRRRKLIGSQKIKKTNYYFALYKKISGGESRVSYDDVIEHICRVSKSRHFYGIQSATAIHFLINKVFHDPTMFSKVHKIQKIRQVVIDSVADEKGLKYLKEANFNKEVKMGHFGRPTVMSVATDIPLPLFTEVLTDGRYVYILNHSKSHYEIINSSVVASTYISLIDYLKRNSRKINQAEIWL